VMMLIKIYHSRWFFDHFNFYEFGVDSKMRFTQYSSSMVEPQNET
jgi:hypothetical protein